MIRETNIDEGEYKADFIISENYIKFSSELLRLSLIAIGAYGTLFIKEIDADDKSNFIRDNHILLFQFYFSSFLQLPHYSIDIMLRIQ